MVSEQRGSQGFKGEEVPFTEARAVVLYKRREYGVQGHEYFYVRGPAKASDAGTVDIEVHFSDSTYGRWVHMKRDQGSDYSRSA
jgi:hypothetical protein